jgi:PAS domain S-box-containing protein
MSYQSKILIADDDEIVRENLEDLLSHDNHLLEFAVNGQEALEKAFNNSFDVILLDIMMPYMDGLQTCQKLREHPATAEIPIIILTALDDRASRINGIKAGADDFISKPFDHTELRTRIRSIIRLNRYRRLLAERTKFERVVENSETGYLLIGEQDQIVFVNSKASFYLGLPTDELVGQSFLTVAKMHYRPAPMEAWLTWPDDALPGVSRYLVQPESPTARDFWLQANVLDHLYAEPNPIWIVSLVDVTAQMTSLREVREFHALIAHKLHTPLNSILVSAEILSQRGHESSLTSILRAPRKKRRGVSSPR